MYLPTTHTPYPRLYDVVEYSPRPDSAPTVIMSNLTLRVAEQAADLMNAQAVTAHSGYWYRVASH